MDRKSDGTALSPFGKIVPCKARFTITTFAIKDDEQTSLMIRVFRRSTSR
jgi:hypothetical protein